MVPCQDHVPASGPWGGLFSQAAGPEGLPGALLVLALLVLAGLALRTALRAVSARSRNRLEGQLRATQESFRLLVEGVEDYAIFLLDPQGRITSWNPGAERLSGYTEAEALGVHFSRLFPEEEVAAGLPEALLRRTAESGRALDEGWRIHKDGTRFLTSAVVTALRDTRGELQGFAKVTRDITRQWAHRRELQALADSLEAKVDAQVQELRESQARLEGFVRHAPAAIAFKDLEGRYLLINPRMEALLGRAASEILGRTNEDLLPDPLRLRYRELDRQVLQHQRDLRQEEQWSGGDGATRFALVHLFPLVDATGRCWGLGIFITDLTEAREADQAQLQRQKLESLGVLTGGIAHDFNNLLGAMLGNVELALTEASLAEAAPHLETLKALMDRSADLLKRMLAYAGQGKSTVTILDLNELVREMITLLGSSVSKKAILHQDLHPGALPLEGDPAQIQQLVMNLVINASEAMLEQNGSIHLRTRAEVLDEPGDPRQEGEPLPPGPYVTLEVSDTGAGMAPEVLKRIFEPFFTTKFTGRGLGLAAIHGIVRDHRGAIRVRSEPGRGSSFRVLFPAATGPPPLPPAPPPPKAAAGARLEGMVLVVDDEAAMREVAVKAIARLGLQPLQARDGQEALALFQRHPEGIRLVLLDLTMPNMDGLETCRELRRRGATVPVILTSGFSESAARARFADLDLAGFLQKPFGLAALTELVGRVLGQPTARR